MYFVKYGRELLHDPRTDECILADLTFEGAENEHSTCSFSLHPGHPLYDAVREKDHVNEVVVYDDRLGEDDPYFVGQVEEVVQEFDLMKTVSCTGELDYLNDSLARPYTSSGSHTVTVNNGDYFRWLVEESHNSQVDARKRFLVDVNQASVMGGTAATMTSDGSYPTTGEVIAEMLDTYGGVLRVKRIGGVRYVDYLTEWEDTNAQVFDFGVNITDFMRTDDALDLATYCIPVGAKLGETEYEHDKGYRKATDAAPVEGTTYYTLGEDGTYSQQADLEAFEPGTAYYTHSQKLDESGNRLTIAGLADGPYDDDVWKQGDILYSRSGVERYGWIGMKFSDGDYTVRENLERAGAMALKARLSPKRTIEIQGVDLSLVNPEYRPLKVGEYVRVRSKPHGFDSYMLCTGVSLDLNSPDASTYTLGTTFDKLTGQQNRRINALNGTINKTYEDAAAISEQARQAAKDAAEKAAAANKTAQKAENAAASAVVATRDEYAVSDSQTEAPTDGWSQETPTKASGQFVWRRTVTTYGDGSEVVGNPAVMSGSDGESATVLRIDSSRGTVFKNSGVATVLTAVIYHGSQRIDGIEKLRESFGASAYLEWSWQRLGENAFGAISAEDDRIGNDGFSFTLTPDDVDTKVVFMCTLNY